MAAVMGVKEEEEVEAEEKRGGGRRYVSPMKIAV